MITYLMIVEYFVNSGIIEFKTIVGFILLLPFTIALDITKDIVIFTILWNIIKFAIKFI